MTQELHEVVSKQKANGSKPDLCWSVLTMSRMKN